MSWLSSVRHGPAVRELPASDPRVIRATDLGGVQVLKHGDLYLLCDSFGDVRPDSRGLGLYAGDTRIVSCLALQVNGARPVLLRSGGGGEHRGLIQMTNADVHDEHDSERDPASVGLARRSLGIGREQMLDGELHERVTVANYTQRPEMTVVELAVEADAADIFEVRGHPRPVRGRYLPILVRDDGRVTFRYEGLDGRTRWTYLEVARPRAIERAPDGAEGAVTIRWERELAPGADFSVEWRIWTSLTETRSLAHAETEHGAPSGRPAGPAAASASAEVGISAATDASAATNASGPSRHGSDNSRHFPAHPAHDHAMSAAENYDWNGESTEISSDNELFDLVIRRSLADLRLLSTGGPSPGERYVAAGIPWYTALFGRDALIAGLQTLAFRPTIAVEALEVLAARQAVEVDDWRDAQPGKILHELRTGEMARTRELPYTPYYGSVDATPLWLITLSSVFEWTGDIELLNRLWPNALAALRWIDEFATGPDGFVAYERRSPQGLVNQGWKDSGDSVVDRKGHLAEPPIALAEVQGYVYDARMRMAALARVRGETELAGRLEADAAALRARFESAFWLSDRHYYAMAIGRGGHVADAIGSNVGQCLWSGILAPERAAMVAARLTAPDLDSGWGVRTLASGQPGYNPIGYHTGTVWPHDNAIIIAGLRRYGLEPAANALAGKLFEAAQSFEGYRLPELFCGFQRTAMDPPVPYPVACSPQAWSAGASLHMLASMLGLRANAAAGELELRRPHLPAWLSRVTINRLQVGGASVDLLFHNWRGTTSAEVLHKRGDVAVTIRL